MKRIISIILSITLAASLAACGTQAQNETASASAETSQMPETSSEEETVSAAETSEAETLDEAEAADGFGNVLIAYFSWADNVVLDDDVDAVATPRVVAPGNAQQLAGWIQERTGGDLFSIRVSDPYPSDWDACLERANEERGEDARPELVEFPEDMENYDVVFLGYPNWWYGVPMALLTFLENSDLSGKQVYLFCSHGTGGLARSVDIITEALPDAEISDSVFDCYEEEASGSREEIESWLAELGY